MDNIEIVKRLTKVNSEEIHVSDDGFLSTGYVIRNGEIIFKFKKHPDVSYENEIRLLDFLNSENLNVNLQRVGWISPDDSYVGLYGVKGKAAEHLSLSDEEKLSVGSQLGVFLKKLHSLSPDHTGSFSVEEEISAWQERFLKSAKIMTEYFTSEEMEKLHSFVFEKAPKELTALGEKQVFSHADLGEGNIFLDDNGKVGVIDFNESAYADEAADFMDIEDDSICNALLEAYGADDTLREKVKIRRLIRPLFVIETYSQRGQKAVEKYIDRIRQTLL